jgi:hypothetical protein
MKAQKLFDAGYAVPSYSMKDGFTYHFNAERIKAECWPKHHIEGHKWALARIEEVRASEVKNGQ